MKSKLKKIIALAACFALSLSALVACVDDETPEGGDPSGEEQEKPENPEKPETPTWTTEAYDNFVSNMKEQGNYRYARTENNSTSYYEISGGIVRIKDGKEDYFLYNENNRDYRLAFSANDFKYHKTDADAFDVNVYIYDDMKSAVLDSFDAETGTYTVTLDGDEYSMTLSDTKITFVNDEVKHVVDKVGSTSLAMPNESDIIDETSKEPQEKPNPPAETEEKIFTLNAQGQRVYNYDLLAETMFDALGKKLEDDTKTLGETLILGFKSVEEVKYFRVADGKVEIGATGTYINGGNTFYVLTIDEETVENANSKEQLTNALISGEKSKITGVPQVYEYSTDTDECSEKVTIAAQNVIDLLAKDGVQPTSVNIKGEPLTYLSGAKVAFAYTMKKQGTAMAGHDMGWIEMMDIVIVTDNGYRLNARTRTLSDETPLDRLYEGVEKTFVVDQLTPIEVTKVVSKTTTAQ